MDYKNIDEEFDYPTAYPEYKEPKITREQRDYALSLVGKWCICPKDLTPFLTKLLCKVVSVNDNKRGGNESQVRIIVFRNSERFSVRKWYLIPTTTLTEVVDSGWLKPTNARPTKIDYLKTIASVLLRISVSQISGEATSFKYQWWKGDTMWRYTPPINNILSAMYDFGRSFRYGVYLEGCRNKF